MIYNTEIWEQNFLSAFTWVLDGGSRVFEGIGAIRKLLQASSPWAFPCHPAAEVCGEHRLNLVETRHALPGDGTE